MSYMALIPGSPSLSFFRASENRNAPPLPLRSIAVVGAGWAGCAAAVELARRGYRPTLFEASRTLGGRARAVDAGGKRLDNGQHILLGAYTESLRLMREVGIDAKSALLTLPLQMRYPPGSGGMDFQAARLPAPLHLLAALWSASGLGREDKMALARFTTTARWMGWRLHVDCSVAELLDRFDQTPRLSRLMWRPLCIAALNTPPERASAQVFLNVLRDSLGARRGASDMLIPRVDLTALFPSHAAAFIERNGGTVRLGAPVRAVLKAGGRWQIDTGTDERNGIIPEFDGVVIATQAPQAARLLAGAVEFASLNAFSYEPITTCYLQYQPEIRLALPMLALLDDPASGRWGQFVFDRGRIDPAQRGLLAVVVSASTQAAQSGREALIDSLAGQLAVDFARPELARPEWAQIITEKRATFSCTPGLARPDNATSMRGVYLAGDYTAGEYPATLEAAVRSGLRAARLVMEQARCGPGN